MKKKKMTRQGVFAFWSLMLVLAALWAIWKEYYAPEWRQYQTEFRELTYDMATEEIQRENQKIETVYSQRLAELDQRIQELLDETRSVNRQEQIAEMEAEIARLEYEEYKTGQALSFAKSMLGNIRSVYEFLKNDPYATRKEVQSTKEQYDYWFEQVQELTPPADKAYNELTAAKAALAEVIKGPADLQRERDAIFAEMNEWRKRAEEIRPEDVVSFTANTIRDVPLIDFLGPKYNLNQVVLEDLPDLTGTAKVDRCTTCHLGIADPRYEGEEIDEPFRAHPHLELFVGADSPHPVEKFGCTTCHLGRGYGTTFTLAAHTPNDEEQAERWADEYDWDYMHYWDYPMLPKRMNQAMCFTCHKPNTGYELTSARKIFEGRQIYERRGCHGCHKIEGVSDDMSKIGPSLENLRSKLNPEWIPRWVSGPRDFYETARMPHAFGHAIPSEYTFPGYVHHIEEEFGEGHFDEQFGEMVEEQAVVIDSISAFLWEQGGEIDMDEPPADPGDVEIGKQLVAKVNCLACHKLDALDAPGEGYGPDLSKIGTKTNRKWLYNWLRDPKKYWPEGNMPDPRLTDEEANHITAYLLTLRDDKFMEAEFVEPTSEMLDVMTERYMRAKMSESEAVAQLAQMSDHEKKLYVGEEAVYRNGCFGCHDIKGFENRGRIGAELTAEAFKEIELFDFGTHKYVHLPHSRHDWIETKVKQPQIYFLGKVQNPYEQQLAMPWFGFSDEEAEKISTFIMGQTGSVPPEPYLFNPRGSKADVLAGRKIIERKNCQGCHQIGLGEQLVDIEDFDFREHLVWVTDPVIAMHDPNLPENRFTKVMQVQEGAVTVGDKLIIPRDGFVDGDVVFGEDDYYGLDEIFSGDQVTVDVGATDEVRVELERPDQLRVNGLGEGYVAQFYSEVALAPPILRNEGNKVRPEWFFQFLKNVTEIRSNLEVRMPQWEWTDEEATAVVKYFAAAATDPEPFPYKSEELQPLGDYHRKTAREIFGLPGTEQYRTSLQCFSCHPSGELTPTSPPSNWGPNLYLASERLKTSFIESWLKYPMSWSPGTRMPAFFYDRDGGALVEVPPASPAVGELGAENAIKALAEMLYYLPEIEEVSTAIDEEVERRKAEPQPTPAPAAPVDGGDGFDDFGDFGDVGGGGSETDAGGEVGFDDFFDDTGGGSEDAAPDAGGFDDFDNF